MVDVPAVTPVITPELLTVATLVVLLVQVPPVVAVVNVVVLPTQTFEVPVICSIVGVGYTVTVVNFVEEQPLPLVTV